MRLQHVTRWIFLLLTVVLSERSWALDTPYAQKLKNRLAENSQKSLAIFQLASMPSAKYTPFPSYYNDEVATYLSTNMAEFDVKMHPLILEYISFWSSQPEQILRAWMGVNNFYLPELERGLSSIPLPKNICYLPFSMATILPTIGEEGGKAGAWGMYSAPFIAMGGKIENGIDERNEVSKSTRYAATYLHQLYLKYNDWTLATTAFVCGASALNKALLATENSRDYWELYSFLPEASRDFYPAMLACAYVLDNPKWKLQAFSFSLKENTQQLIVQDTVYKEQLIDFFNLNSDVFEWNNAAHTGSIFYPKQSISFRSSDKIDANSLQKASEWKKEQYAAKKSDTCYVFYHTKRGDYFHDLTNWFGLSLEQIKEQNHLSSNTLPKREDVFFRVAKKDSALYASFDTMNREEKDRASGHETTKVETATPHQQTFTSNYGKTTIYTIQSGDTLWKIAQKYHTTDAKIMEWNGINEDIQPGQKIKIYE